MTLLHNDTFRHLILKIKPWCKSYPEVLEGIESMMFSVFSEIWNNHLNTAVKDDHIAVKNQ